MTFAATIKIENVHATKPKAEKKNEEKARKKCRLSERIAADKDDDSQMKEKKIDENESEKFTFFIFFAQFCVHFSTARTEIQTECNNTKKINK